MKHKVGHLIRFCVGVLIGLPLCFLATWGTNLRCQPSSKTNAAPSSRDPLATLYAMPLPTALDGRGRTRLKDLGGSWRGTSDDSLLTRIRSQKIEKITFNRGGSSVSLRLHLADGSSAAFKPDQVHQQTDPRKEIAAYRLNKLLGLSRVPPATHRTLSWKEVRSKMASYHRHLLRRVRRESLFGEGNLLHGEVSWWIPEIKYVPIDRFRARARWYGWLNARHRLPPQYARVASQISKMLVFDFIINNPDRFSGYNTMATPDTEFLYFMDNTYSFHPKPRGGSTVRRMLRRCQRFSRDMYRRLKALTAADLRRELDKEKGAPWPILKEDEFAAVISRRNEAIQYINGIIARHGWEKVMVFP